MVNKQYTIRDTQSELLKYAISHTHHASRIMQNKPNLRNNQMSATKVLTKHYENKSNWKLGKNKPNQTQFHPHRLYPYFNFLLWDVVRPKLCRADSKISLIPNTQITPNTDNLREWGLSRGLCVSK